MISSTLTPLSRKVVFTCGLALLLVLFVPLWQIELSAPQYPEGLVLKMYPHKLGGNVDIINGLNHYIGMKTLHTEDFLEFTVLPYLIGFFAFFSMVVSIWLKGLRSLLVLFIAFLGFGILSMADFWRWEYAYGHELDPNAAINVPGMSYQPPLIGYKQLLNFGAYSTPDTGGWIFIVVGFTLLVTVIAEYRHQQKKALSVPRKTILASLGAMILLSSSCNVEPSPIKVGTDACSFCRMSVTERRFGAELITTKGKIYKFDDLHCLIEFVKSKTVPEAQIRSMLVINYEKPHGFIALEEAFLVKSESLRSPMGSNIAAFLNEKDWKASPFASEGVVVTWNKLIPQQK